MFASSRYMFVGAAEFDQCLLDTSFPGDALDTNMFGGTAGASYNPVSDLSDERCPATAAPSTTPHAPVYSTRQRLHVFDHLSEAELEQLNEDIFTASHRSKRLNRARYFDASMHTRRYCHRSAAPVTVAPPPLTSGNSGGYSIGEARDDWFSNQAAATVKYGHITDWDTSNVTSMSHLFCGLDGSRSWFPDMCSRFNADFNDDISKWDVAKVPTT